MERAPPETSTCTKCGGVIETTANGELGCISCLFRAGIDSEQEAMRDSTLGTLEVGVPNPQCVRGRTVRLANVITLPEHRGQGHGTTLVLDVVAWARSIAADRVDLSATPAGQRIYERLGFTVTSAPRMKLVL